MFFNSIIINLKSKKIKVVIISSIILAIVLITTTIFSLKFETNRKNKTNKSVLEYLHIADISDIYSYYSEYELTVVSNKNKNTYNIKEWLYINKNEDKKYFKFENIGNNEEKIEYIFKNNALIIKNYNQKNVLVNETYPLTSSNLLSTYTFISMYLDIKEEIENTNQNIGFKLENKKEKNFETFSIIIEDSNIVLSEKLSEYKDVLNKGLNISKIELVFNTSLNKMEQLNIYNENGEIYISIVYKTFNLNQKIDEKLFDF